MRNSIGVLFACSLAGAIPLRKGDSWTWQIVLHANPHYSNWRSARVLDSVGHDSGVVWRIQARDSSTGWMDTGSILERPDGTQNWLKASRYLDWEPQPLPRSEIGKERSRLSDADPYPWGLAALGRPEEVTTRWSIRSRPGIRVCEGEDSGGHFLANCPEHQWDDRLGVVRLRTTRATRNSEDWILTKRGDLSVALPSLSLRIPDSSTVLEWQEIISSNARTGGNNESDYRYHLNRKWQIIAWPRDSAGWIQTTALETVTSLTGVRIDTIYLRLNPLTGQRRSNQWEDIPSPDEAWWLHPADSLSEESNCRYRNVQYSVSGNGSEKESLWMKIDSNHNVDSMEWSHKRLEVISGEFTARRRLLSVNGILIRTLEEEVVTANTPRRRADPTPTALALRHPRIPVRWRDARGRTGQFLAGDLLRSASAGRGVLFLEAVLPDGSRWRGVHLSVRR